MEEWRDIKGYEGFYQVSNCGRVKSLERDFIQMSKYGKTYLRHQTGKILNLSSAKSGHLYVRLSKNGKIEKHKLVHHIVAEAFIPNPNRYTVVHHKDHNPMNNCVENLMWISEGEHKGLHISERRSKVVYQYTLEGELVAVWKNACEAARQTGLGQCYICLACNNKNRREGNNKYKGYIWSYEQLCS